MNLIKQSLKIYIIVIIFGGKTKSQKKSMVYLTGDSVLADSRLVTLMKKLICRLVMIGRLYKAPEVSTRGTIGEKEWGSRQGLVWRTVHQSTSGSGVVEY